MQKKDKARINIFITLETKRRLEKISRMRFGRQNVSAAIEYLTIKEQEVIEEEQFPSNVKVLNQSSKR